MDEFPAMTRICLIPKVHGVGGMVSFQARLEVGLKQRGIDVCFDLRDGPYTAVLVIGGTRDLLGLWRARRKGIPIVQRLNGMNWMHHVHPTGLRRYLRAEYGNFILSVIRSRLATRIVYQSQFALEWWERAYLPAPAPHAVIYNGVDLKVYTPDGPHQRPPDCFRLLLVEGNLGGGYEHGLATAVMLAEQLAGFHQLPIELMVVGRVPPHVQEIWTRHSRVQIRWTGQVARSHIPELDRSAHLLYSADVNAACPNSVIEALACGLPVLAFDTGALPELVPNGPAATHRAGRIVAYGGNPWHLDPPDHIGLARAAADILADQASFRPAARAHAEEVFGLDKMTDQYLDALLAPG
jgi:glycosyltransferase involved in cell wall biosynthesis